MLLVLPGHMGSDVVEISCLSSHSLALRVCRLSLASRKYGVPEQLFPGTWVCRSIGTGIPNFSLNESLCISGAVYFGVQTEISPNGTWCKEDRRCKAGFGVIHGKSESDIGLALISCI